MGCPGILTLLPIGELYYNRYALNEAGTLSKASQVSALCNLVFKLEIGQPNGEPLEVARVQPGACVWLEVASGSSAAPGARR
jgi:hypothetical protein